MYTKTNDKNVLINFDVENRHIEQLLGFSLPQFPPDAGFYFNMLLNCEKKYGHPYENYIEMRAMHVHFRCQIFEVDDDFWYNLTQMCYQKKLIMIDGEMKATDLPLGENPRFMDVYGDDSQYYSDIRKELKA